MTDRDALLALADRAEALDGPDREVDAEIFRAIGAPVPFQFANKLVALTFDAGTRYPETPPPFSFAILRSVPVISRAPRL